MRKAQKNLRAKRAKIFRPPKPLRIGFGNTTSKTTDSHKPPKGRIRKKTSKERNKTPESRAQYHPKGKNRNKTSKNRNQPPKNRYKTSKNRIKTSKNRI